MKTAKMKIKIWGDITCTYCYTAKRQFEKALSLFPHKDEIEIEWKSFELAPGLVTNPQRYLPQFLAELNHLSSDQVGGMIRTVTESVKGLGLEFNLEKAIPANSFNAHRLSHLAKNNGKQDEVKERLYKAYFTEGKNIDDINTLIELAAEIGLDRDEVKMMLTGRKYADEVALDIQEARQKNISSVPHFRFNENITIAGARDSSVFLVALTESFDQWKKEARHQTREIIDGASCGIEGDCN